MHYKSDMKRFLSVITIFIAALISAQAQSPEKSIAVQFLEANDEVKGAKCMKIDGLMMRMARPTLKKTPAVAIMDNLDRFYMFSFKENMDAEENAFVAAAEKMLKSYTKASEIKDDISHMIIYLDSPDGKIHHEMIMLVTWPSTSMMVFHGNFSEDSLRRMDEISKKQRAEGTGTLTGLYRNGQMPD